VKDDQDDTGENAIKQPRMSGGFTLALMSCILFKRKNVKKGAGGAVRFLMVSNKTLGCFLFSDTRLEKLVDRACNYQFIQI